jgi:hypothetical protein
MTRDMTKLPIVVVAGVLGVAGCGGESSNAPKAEISETPVKLDLPAVPDFNMPQPLGDGSHTAQEMRLRSSKYVDQNVAVTGYIVSVYDMNKCAHELGAKMVKEKDSLCAGREELSVCMFKVGKKAVDEKPDLCQRPHFYLADSPGASIDKAIEVVDVPRGLREDEKKFPEIVEEFKKRPPPPDLDTPLQQQQKIRVAGKWSTKSPLGFTNSDGLLVFESLAPAM